MNHEVRTMKHILKHLILWLVLTSLLVACIGVRKKTNVGNGTGDMSLRTLQPCAPPCWHNIVPGRSTAADVRQVLATLPFIITQSIEEIPYPEEGLAYFRWRYTDPAGEYGTIWLRDGTVMSVDARPGFKLELREVIDRFGPPERILPSRALFPDAPGYYSIGLYYPGKGLTFRTVELPELSLDAKGYPVAQDYLIGTVHYLEPTTLERLLIHIDPSVSPLVVQHAIERMYPWQGFGMFPFRPTPTPERP
jgi:hypothetical protein